MENTYESALLYKVDPRNKKIAADLSILEKAFCVYKLIIISEQMENRDRMIDDLK
jgi:hypothetical protein